MKREIIEQIQNLDRIESEEFFKDVFSGMIQDTLDQVQEALGLEETIDEAYDRGFSDGEDSVGYDNEAYNDGYEAGYEAGHSDGIEESED